MTVPFTDLTREWAYFENAFLKGFKNFGRAGIYVSGSALQKFERDFADYNGYKYAVGLATGMAALEVALRAYGIKSGDEVITVANSAAATALAISHTGAKPIFCDVKDDFLIDEEKISGLITAKTRAILPVHLFGKICNLEAINRIAAVHNLIVIEDACQAHGAKSKGAAGMNAKAFSFYPTKNLGALGEGGLILTNDKNIRDFAVSYRDYGQTERYKHVIKGNNYRLSPLQCVFLDIKLQKIADFIARRKIIAKKYISALSGIKELKINGFDGSAAYHLFVIRVLNDKRDDLRAYLENKGIATLVHYPTAIYDQLCYREEYPKLTLEKTEAFQTEILSLPCYPFLTAAEQDYIIKKIKEYFS